MLQYWFHVKSDWQKNPDFSTLCQCICFSVEYWCPNVMFIGHNSWFPPALNPLQSTTNLESDGQWGSLQIRGLEAVLSKRADEEERRLLVPRICQEMLTSFACSSTCWQLLELATTANNDDNDGTNVAPDNCALCKWLLLPVGTRGLLLFIKRGL